MKACVINLFAYIFVLVIMVVLTKIFVINQDRLVRVVGYYNLTMCRNGVEVILPVIEVDQLLRQGTVQIRVDVNGEPFEYVERDWYDVDISRLDFDLLPYYLKSINERNEHRGVTKDVELMVRYKSKKLTSVWEPR